MALNDQWAEKRSPEDHFSRLSTFTRQLSFWRSGGCYSVKLKILLQLFSLLLTMGQIGLVFALEKQTFGCSPFSCKFLRDSNLISAFCFDAHNHSLETWIFCLFNQANTKWKLSALDSQIGFSFRKAMKVHRLDCSIPIAKLWLKEASFARIEFSNF